MPWVFHLPAGAPYPTLLRAAELILALAPHQPVRVRVGRGAEAWIQLLPDGTAFRGLVLDVEGMGDATHIWCLSGDAVPAAPPTGTWLLLIDAAGAAPPAVLAAYERVFGFAGGTAPTPFVCLPETGPWDAVVPLLLSAHTQSLPPCTYPLGRHVVTHHPVPPAAAPAGDARVALLVPGPKARPTPALLAWLGGYDAVAVATREVPGFFVELLAALRPQTAAALAAYRPPESVDDVLHWLEARLNSERAQALDVCHVEGGPGEATQLRQGLAAWLAHRERLGTARPTVLVSHRKPFATATQSLARIGAGVAQDGLQAGLMHDARGRFNLTWMSGHGLTDNRDRLYLYPFTPSASADAPPAAAAAAPHFVGLDGDEVDPALLPALLGARRLALLCHLDPFVLPSLAARALWARYPLPVVGMLHSIHTSRLGTDSLLALLSAPTYPFDAFISPSRCGAASLRGLFDSLTAWLAARGTIAPPFAGRVEVIPYGIDTTSYAALSRPSCRDALDIPPTARVVLSLGRFSRREKANLLPLLFAVQRLRAKVPHLLLVLAGSPGPEPYVAELEQAVASLGLGDVVRFWADVSAQDKRLLYGAADVFVSISDNLQETYGLTLLEAMAAGLPVVASEWNGHRETVRHGETGFLVPTLWTPPPGDLLHVQRLAEGTAGYGHHDLHETVAVEPAALERALATLLADPTLRATWGAAGRALCLAEHAQEQQSRRIGELLLTLLEEAAHTPWTTPGAFTPWADPVGARFAHYPTAMLTDDVCLRPGPTPPTADRLALIGITTRAEVAFTEQLCAAAAVGPRVDALVRQLANPSYAPAAVKLRLLRALKYGLLERTP